MPIAASAASWSPSRGARVVGHEHDPTPRRRGGGRRLRRTRGSAGGPATPRRRGRRARRRGSTTGAPYRGATAVERVTRQNGARAPLRTVPRPALRPRRRPRRRRSPRPTTCCRDADVDELEARDPHNIVHVDVPRGGDRPLRDGRPAAARVDRRRRAWSADDDADVHALPHALHRRRRRGPRPRRRARRRSRSSTRAPAACSPTSAPRPRRRPTGST